MDLQLNKKMTFILTLIIIVSTIIVLLHTAKFSEATEELAVFPKHLR